MSTLNAKLNKLIAAIFTDGSCYNGAIDNRPGATGYGVVWVFPDGSVHTVGESLRLSTSSEAERLAFARAIKSIPLLFKKGMDGVVIHTDYLAVVEAIQSIASGKLIGKYVDQTLVREVKACLQEVGISFSRFQKGREVVSDCGRLTVKWVKAHTADEEALETLDPITLGNRAADKVAKDFAKRALES